ncbi:hypothetical protein [Paenibacillus luteus]|uniref:hypothetical protein n=1 Tax=Paenibacillus luteus TaxID=2545753 RepID=UPI001141E4FD|nr:hypothetical protein [Paenibacillus luteus]
MKNIVRAYHVKEVSHIKDLDIGKKIRCHYASGSKKVGLFSRLGLQTSTFINEAQTVMPEGDFYFICVKRDDKEIFLIADRVIQTYISAKTIMNFLHQNQKEKKISFENYDNEFYLSIPTGGITSNDKANDWDAYIMDGIRNKSHLFSKKDWFLEGPAATWTKDKPEKVANFENLQVVRGIGVYRKKVSGENDNQYTYGTYTNENEATGFRPVIKVYINQEVK